MSNPTTLAAPTRRLFAGLIVATIATASAGAWALTAGATGPTDEPTTTAATVEDVTVGRPAATASDLVAAATRPIVVADAYHGVGFTVCRNGAQPIVVADAYHGVGFSVCRDGAQPIVFAGPYPWAWITICRNGIDPIVVADAYHGVGNERVPVNPPGNQISRATRTDRPYEGSPPTRQLVNNG